MSTNATEVGKDLNLPNERVIRVADILDTNEALRVSNLLDSLNHVNQENILIIFDNCHGGDHSAGYKMYKNFLFSKSTIVSLVKRKADSAGLVAMIGCHIRYAYADATFFLHDITWIKEVDFKEAAKVQDYYDDLFAKRASKSLEEIRLVSSQGKKFSAQEALDWKFITEIVQPKHLYELE